MEKIYIICGCYKVYNVIHMCRNDICLMNNCITNNRIIPRIPINRATYI